MQEVCSEEVEEINTCLIKLETKQSSFCVVLDENNYTSNTAELSN
jgi:hypothetical protein